MTQREYACCLERLSTVIDEIRVAAHSAHAAVNQTYGDHHPYGYHLDMVADGVRRYGHEVCTGERDVLPLFFGAYFHDSIEDARLSYNDVRRLARRWMDEEQSLVAAEIVFALTNDKGRTRAERAGAHYFQGIRETPFAPFVKLADRLANMRYSSENVVSDGRGMHQVYQRELREFLSLIDAHRCGVAAFCLPSAMLNEIDNI